MSLGYCQAVVYDPKVEGWRGCDNKVISNPGTFSKCMYHSQNNIYAVDQWDDGTQNFTRLYWSFKKNQYTTEVQTPKDDRAFPDPNEDTNIDPSTAVIAQPVQSQNSSIATNLDESFNLNKLTVDELTQYRAQVGVTPVKKKAKKPVKPKQLFPTETQAESSGGKSKDEIIDELQDENNMLKTAVESINRLLEEDDPQKLAVIQTEFMQGLKLSDVGASAVEPKGVDQQLQYAQYQNAPTPIPPPVPTPIPPPVPTPIPPPVPTQQALSRMGYTRRPATVNEELNFELRKLLTKRNKLKKIKEIKESRYEDVSEEIEILDNIEYLIYDIENQIRGVPMLVRVPEPEEPFVERNTPRVDEDMTTEIEKKLTAQPLAFQKQFQKLFFDLNQFIANSIKNKVFIDTNYIFGEIKAKTGDFFTFDQTNAFLVPIFDKIQFYNEGRLVGYNPVNVQFPTFKVTEPTVLYSAPPKNVLPGTNNEIIFQNIPDKGVYSQYMGIYGNIKHPEFPPITLKHHPRKLSGKFVCYQKFKNRMTTRAFDDVHQAKGWAIRGGFYADQVEKLRQSAIQGRYERKLRVIPTVFK
jgi:hypothetical protein